MFNEDMEVTTSNYRHYAINILPKEICNFEEIEQVLIFKEDESDESKIQNIIKLQKQFGLSSSKNLEDVLKRASMPLSTIGDIINKDVSHCKTCQQYKKSVPRPTESLPKANDFSDTVAIDLNQLEPNLCHLHLIEFNLITFNL